MNPEAQRIAIAEACGNIRTKHSEFTPEQWKQWYDALDKNEIIPDYLNDLNACHEMEKTLTEKEELFYLMKLSAAMKENATIGWKAERTYRATAAQRCEAFLRSKGLWKEETP